MNHIDRTTIKSCAIIGAGRVGNSLAFALREAGIHIKGPISISHDLEKPLPQDLFFDVQAVFLCIPDSVISRGASLISVGPLVGHCSAITTLDALRPHESFAFHPLMTFPSKEILMDLTGTSCAITGSTPQAEKAAQNLALAAGMQPFVIADCDRGAYHAGAVFASGFLVELLDSAQKLLETASVDRRHLIPLIRATLDNWEAFGTKAALTGPIARGDEVTIALHREVIAERIPELKELFDSLIDVGKEIANEPH